MSPTPTPPIRTPRPNPPTDPKSQKKKWLAITALLTSTPFLIAIAVHVLALLGLGSIVIFKGGNPLSIFTSENVESADSGPESSAPPSTDDSPPEDSAPAMAETTPTEIDNSTEILALSTPTTVPTFAPPTPAKLSTPTTSLGQGSAGTGTKSGGGGSGGGKGRRTSKSTLFGFSETTEDDLVGTMYDLKLDPTGRKPTDIGTKDTDFYGAVRGILSGNRVNPAALRKYFAVPKKLGATQIFMPMGQASEAPKIFGVADKVKPNYWIIQSNPTTGLFIIVAAVPPPPRVSSVLSVKPTTFSGLPSTVARSWKHTGTPPNHSPDGNPKTISTNTPSSILWRVIRTKIGPKPTSFTATG